MNQAKEQFIFTAIMFILLLIAFLFLITMCWEAAKERFGTPGFIPVIIGALTLFGGGLVSWGTVITWLDRRALRRYRTDPKSAFEIGQVVALSGYVRVNGTPLEAPFSQTPCAAYRYQVTAQRRNIRSNNSTRQQLCLLGFALSDAHLDCGTRSFPLHAVPDVDTDLRSISTGGEWGDLGRDMIDDAANNEERVDEPFARGALSYAYKTTIPTQPPLAKDFFVSSTRSAGPEISIIEDAVPINTPVTVLAAYDARTGGLDGKRLGGLKVFAGQLDERLAILNQGWRKGLQISLPLLATGTALMTLAWWLPA